MQVWTFTRKDEARKEQFSAEMHRSSGCVSWGQIRVSPTCPVSRELAWHDTRWPMKTQWSFFSRILDLKKTRNIDLGAVQYSDPCCVDSRILSRAFELQLNSEFYGSARVGAGFFFCFVLFIPCMRPKGHGSATEG